MLMFIGLELVMLMFIGLELVMLMFIGLELVMLMCSSLDAPKARGYTPCKDNVFRVVLASSISARASAPSDRIKLFEIFWKGFK